MDDRIMWLIRKAIINISWSIAVSSQISLHLLLSMGNILWGIYVPLVALGKNKTPAKKIFQLLAVLQFLSRASLSVTSP